MSEVEHELEKAEATNEATLAPIPDIYMDRGYATYRVSGVWALVDRNDHGRLNEAMLACDLGTMRTATAAEVHLWEELLKARQAATTAEADNERLKMYLNGQRNALLKARQEIDNFDKERSWERSALSSYQDKIKQAREALKLFASAGMGKNPKVTTIEGVRATAKIMLSTVK